MKRALEIIKESDGTIIVRSGVSDFKPKDEYWTNFYPDSNPKMNSHPMIGNCWLHTEKNLEIIGKMQSNAREAKEIANKFAKRELELRNQREK